MNLWIREREKWPVYELFTTEQCFGAEVDLPKEFVARYENACKEFRAVQETLMDAYASAGDTDTENIGLLEFPETPHNVACHAHARLNE